MIKDQDYTLPESAGNSIFKKSEHEEIMDELGEIKRRIKDLQTYPPPYIPYPVVPPYDPCQHCCPLCGCGNCPYRYDPDWNKSYPKLYYYGNELRWDCNGTGIPYGWSGR